MSARALVLPVGVLVLLAGCAQSDGPAERTQADITASHLARELPAGAAQLAPFVNRYPADPTVAELAVLASVDRATGRTLVDVALTPPRDSLGMAQPSTAALFRVDTNGHVRLLPRVAEGVVPIDVVARRVVPGIGAIVSCTKSDANGVRLEGDAAVPFDDAPGACLSADVAGESLRPGRWLYLERSGGTLVTVSRSVRGEAPETRTMALPDASAVVAWAREGADGSIAVVTRTGTGFEWRSEGAAPVAIMVADPTSHRIAFDDARDAFVLRAADGSAIVWSPARGEDERLAAPAAPEGSTGPLGGWTYSGSSALPFAEVSIPNPAYTILRVPQRYAVAVLSGSSVQSTDARLTPCIDSGRCRALGESYLLGTVDGATPLGIYAFWSWESLLTLFASPLFAEDAR